MTSFKEEGMETNIERSEAEEKASSLKSFRIRLYAGLAIAALLLALIVYLWPLLKPVFLAFFLAYALHPIIERFAHSRTQRMLAVVVVLFIFILVFLLFLLFFIPTLFAEVQTFIQNFPKYQKEIQTFYLDVLIPWFDENLEVQLPQYREDFQLLAGQRLKDVVPLIWSTIKTTVMGAFTGTLGVAGTLFYLFLIPFFLFFFLRDFDRFKKVAKEAIPYRTRPFVLPLILEIDETLARYFRGILIVMIVLTSLYITGLRLIGLEGAVAIGALSGILYVLPYVGPTIAYVIALIISLLNLKTGWTLVWISILYLLGTQLESWVLTPHISGEKAGLAAWQVILSVIVCASLFGVIGVIIAIPLGAVLKILAKRLFHLYKNSDFYRGSSKNHYNQPELPFK